MFDAAGLQVLDSTECMQLLGSMPIGRIAFTDRGRPAIQPVNFMIHHGAIIVRTRPGSKLAAAARNAPVAFEVDDFDYGRKRGWNVTAVGRAEAVTDPAELAELRELPLRAWAPGRRDHFIRIRIEDVAGRRAGSHP